MKAKLRLTAAQPAAGARGYERSTAGDPKAFMVDGTNPNVVCRNNTSLRYADGIDNCLNGGGNFNFP